MRKSLLILAAIFLTTVLTLVGCSSSPATTSAPTTSAAPATSVAPTTSVAPKPPASATTPNQTHAEVDLTVWTTSPPTDPLVNLITAAEDISRKYDPWLRIKGQGTTGFNYNLITMDGTPDVWKTTVFATSSDSLNQANDQVSPYDKYQIKSANYKFLLSYATPATFLLGLKPINSIADLKGKKIALGLKTQYGIGVLPVGLLSWWGVDEKNSDIQFIGTTKGVQAMLNNQVDACIANVKLNPISGTMDPQADLIELQASGRTIYYYDWGEKAIKVGAPYSSPVPVKAGVFGTNNAFTALGGILYLAVRDVFPDDLAYEFVNVWLNNYQKFGDYTSAGKLIDPQMLTYGLTTSNTAPGAIKAYKEHGIVIPDK